MLSVSHEIKELLMLKLRSMMEDVAEELFGSFLPKIEAQASCTQWNPIGCCGASNEQWHLRRYCWPPVDGCDQHTGECNLCTGICGT
jgi:hypothetical protein